MLMPRLPLRVPVDDGGQGRVCASCEAREVALFGALDADAVARLHAQIPAPTVRPDESVYTRGETGHAVFTVRSGLVRFERLTERGDRRIVRLAGRGGLIGQEALLRQPYKDDAIACTPVVLCRLPVHLVDDLEAAQTPLRRELMARWQRALDDAEAWSADLCAGTSRRRVLKLIALLDRLSDGDGRIWLPRREDIGAMLDMTFETASRVVSQLKREGVMTLLPPRHAVVDRARLDAALHEADS